MKRAALRSSQVLLAVLALAACASGAPPPPSEKIAVDIDATLPDGPYGLRPVLPGNRIPPEASDPVPGR